MMSNMKLMTWSEHFETGVDAIDIQHRKLIDLINAAAPMLSEPGEVAARAVQPLLDSLADYAVNHFRMEEALMVRHGIDSRYTVYHHGVHVGFTEEVAAMRREALGNGNVGGHNLLRFLISWLSFHILAEDQQVARQFRAIAGGASAKQAYEAIDRSDTAAITALTDAMIDMFSLLTERNQNLATANRQLHDAQAELLATNQNLEARVAERTRELEDERMALLAASERIEQTQEQLLQSEKMSAVGQLAAGVAHEINNPIGFVISNLGALTGYVEQLMTLIAAYEAMEARLPTDHPDRATMFAARETAELDFLRQDIPDLLRDSNDGLSRVKRIVGDLKDFSHIDEGEWSFVDLNKNLESTLNVVWNEIKYKAEVIRELGELPLVNCLPAQINQVLMNLLVNAGHAIETRGSITLRSGVEGKKVWIQIVDTGKGMTVEVQRRIFEPFYTTKPVGKGTGLGLSITWDIVERHGGKIEVDSKPGHGSSFRLTLPIERPAASRPA
ncbi:MAG: ATP-binding protein [Rhodocyclales bacterium]|nr:ATP-binding protein [Rhodocyclales bacterium]